MKLCKDCHYFHRSLVERLTFMPLNLGKCLHPSAMRKPTSDYYVDGKVQPKQHHFAATMRLDLAECGSEGRYWEPK